VKHLFALERAELDWATARGGPAAVRTVPVVVPCYTWRKAVGTYLKCAVRDVMGAAAAVAGGYSLWGYGRRPAKLLTANSALKMVPSMDRSFAGRKPLKAAVVFYEREPEVQSPALSTALSAALEGVTVLPYVDATSLTHDPESGRVTGAAVRDAFTGRHWTIAADVVVDLRPRPLPEVTETATGAAGDSVPRMVERVEKRRVNVVLPQIYAVLLRGVAIKVESEGNLVIRPMLDAVVASCDVMVAEGENPRVASKDDISAVVEALHDVLHVPVTRSDVLSTWVDVKISLVDENEELVPTESKKKDPRAGVVPEELSIQTQPGLITVENPEAAGSSVIVAKKILEYAAQQSPALMREMDKTKGVQMRYLAAHQVKSTDFAFISQNWNRVVDESLGRPRSWTSIFKSDPVRIYSMGPIAIDLAARLVQTYGDDAASVAELAQLGWGRALLPDDAGVWHTSPGSTAPVLEAEVVHAVRAAYCCSVSDFLGGRSGLKFLNKAAAAAAVERVADIMAFELGWGYREKKRQMDVAYDELGEE